MRWTIALVLTALSFLLLLGGAATKSGQALFTSQASVSSNTFTTASCFFTWWNSSYGYRKQVTVTTGTASVSSGYSVLATVDHASLVTAGKSLASGNDVRVLYWNAGACAWTQLDRVLEEGSAWNGSATKLWFKLQAGISASASDGNYYLYYGYGSAGAPPANATQVFFSYDDFSASSLGSQWTVLRAPAAGWSQSGGTLNISMDPNKDFWANNNTATLFYVSAPSGDFEAQAKQAGRPTLSGRTGGILAYQNDDNYIANYHEGISNAESLEYVREAAASPTSQISGVSSDPIYLRIRKLGTGYTGWYSTNSGASFSQVGTSQTITLSSLRIGLTAFSYTSSVMTMNFDNFRVRNLVNPEPTTSLGSEQIP